MFVRRVPYESVRRRKIRHWLLLAMRLAALALIVAAFARPFVRGSVAAISGGAREVIVLLDRSYSMGYGDRWTRAQAAARQAIDGLGASDRASLVLFGTGSEVVLQSIDDRARLARGHRRRHAGRRGHALRPGAQGGRDHRRRVDPAAPGSGAHHRLPEERLGAHRRPAPAGGHDVLAGLGRRPRHRQSRRRAGGAATGALRGPGARHRHRRRDQPRHRAGLRRRARPGNRRPRGRDRARGRGAAGVGVARLCAGHGDASRAARRRPRRRRRAGRRQRLPLRAA